MNLKQKIKLVFKILKTKSSKNFEEELDRAYKEEDESPRGDYDSNIKQGLRELYHTFTTQGHSGYSASIVSSVFNQYLTNRCLAPIYDNDEDWVEVGENMFQHKHCSTIFKNGKFAKAYTIDGYYFDDNGGTYTDRYSILPVTFPYYPQKIIGVKENSIKHWWIILKYKLFLKDVIFGHLK